MIEVNNVSMRFNMAKEKHESLKEYFLAAVQGKLQFEEFYALRDVSLTVHKGEFHGIIGLNGSGKSTLLKVISGVFKPTAGNVVVHGSIAPLIELGAGFDMDLTARENIYLNGTVLGLGYRCKDSYYATFRGAKIADNYTIPSYSVFDFTVEIPLPETKWLKDATLRLAVYNIFDKKYVQSTRHAVQCTVGEPRTFEVGVKTTF